ncbi:MAG TPA: hypothetical protein VK581_01400 [Chthoniobacterales bacterium]|nr:hypothetical protein [Chthoniobacterales bacterium]
MDTNADRGRFGRTIGRLRAFVERLGHASTGWIEQLSARRGIFLTSLLVGALAVLLAVFVSFPGTILYHSIFGSRISDTLKLSHNLFARDLQEDILAYRIVVPLLSRWTGTNQPWLLVIVFQWSAIVLTLALNFLAIVRKLGKDGIRFAWPLTLALGLSFVTFWSYWGSGCFDAVTLLMLALALLSSRPWLLALLALVGTLNDERFLIAAPFVVLWHVRGAGIGELFRSAWRRITALLFAVGAVAFIRHGLTHGWWGPGISLPEVYRLIWQDVILGLKPFATHSRATGWLVFLVNVFMSFRWLWWVVIAFVLTPISGVSRTFKILFAGALVSAILSTATVMDVARSVGFLFPAVLLAAVHWIPTNPLRAVRQLWWLLFLLVITPVFCINGNLPAFWLPLPLEAARFSYFVATGKDVLRDVIAPYVWSDSFLLPLRHFRKP